MKYQKILAQVQGIEIRNHEHDFEKAASNLYDYDAGIRVEAGVLYKDNDFEDVSKVELFIEGARMGILFSLLSNTPPRFSNSLMSFILLLLLFFSSCGRRM